MSTWYLGPLGDLRPLVCPERDVKMTDVRYGGVHQGLSGARTMDVTGHRTDFQFNFTYLDQEEWRWLELLHTRQIPGPHFLVNPFKRNRMSLRATRLELNRSSEFRGGGYSPAAGYAPSLDFPPGLGYMGRSIKFTSWTATTDWIRWDYHRPMPILPTDGSYTLSVYLKSEGGVHTGAFLRTRWFNRNNWMDVASPTASIIHPLPDLTTSWQRYSITGLTPPAGAEDSVAVGVAIELDAYDGFPVYVAAPQFEAGPLTDWDLGGATAMVLLDQLETTSPRFPMRDASMTLLEA